MRVYWKEVRNDFGKEQRSDGLMVAWLAYMTWRGLANVIEMACEKAVLKLLQMANVI